jgi:predicted GTPase
MPKKRLPKLDPLTKTFKVADVPSELVQLFDDYIEISAEHENKTKAQVLEEILMPAVEEGFGKENVRLDLHMYRQQQEQIKEMHRKAADNNPKQIL